LDDEPNGRVTQSTPATRMRWIGRLALLPWVLLAILAPVMEKGGAQSQSHVEASGTSIHSAHHHDCVSCASNRNCGAAGSRLALPEVDCVRGTSGLEEHFARTAARWSSAAPRAPPALV
jgi:hypothetical protein